MPFSCPTILNFRSHGAHKFADPILWEMPCEIRGSHLASHGPNFAAPSRMFSEPLPQLSLGGAAVAIFAICAAVVLFKGIARMVLGTLVICVSTWIAFQVWQLAPALSVKFTGTSNPWITNGLPIATFVSAAFLVRKICRAIASPFKESADANGQRSIVGTAFRLLVALIPAAIIWLAGAAYLHHNGTIEEVREFSQKRSPASQPAKPTWSGQLKSAVESAIPQAWLTALNPSAAPSRVALAKLITAQSQSPLKPVIDPQTGRPYPRAIIVDDPELQNLAREGKFGTLLRHPLLTKALNDPAVKKLLNDLSF